MIATKRDAIGIIPERGFTSFVLSVVTILVLIGWAAAYRRSIDYAAADPAWDAMRTFAHGDSRYVAVDADPQTVTLPPGRQFPEETLDFHRDVRLLRAAGEPLSSAQRSYISIYNATMATLVRAGRSEHSLPRPKPVARPVFAIELLVALLPVLFNFYLRYRLGAYKWDGRSWIADLGYPVRPYLTSTYAREAAPLLRLLWATVALFPVWVMVTVFLLFSNGPLR